jgi:purine-nucleoside/S-methyl-5'-thioadenosine phosphorylase / adenosine deaminase
MEWREADGVEWLEASLPGATVAFSTRSAGSVRESPARLAGALGLAADRIATAHQVHGAELVHQGALPCEPVEADGHVLSQPGTAALVYAADCLPVVVAGPGGVAVLHCGWRGLAAGIVARGAAAVEATAGAIGPGIGPCCYEVGAEVLASFAPLGEGIATDRMLDLTAVANRLLRQAGVERTESAGLCTSCDGERFFSHRREGESAGRQAGVAWLDREAGS